MEIWRASLAPFLLLVTPFVTFVQYQRHGFSHPEVLFFLLALALAALVLGAVSARFPRVEWLVLAGLLTLFADIQLEEPGERRLLAAFLLAGGVLWLIRQHAARIVSVAMAAVLGLSLLPLGRSSDAAAPAASPPTAASGRLPLVVHLVLDEHIGVEGLPRELTPSSFSRELESFFIERGFRLFGRAYSEYSSTLWSLAQLLNLSPGGYEPTYSAPAGPGTYRLLKNAYFERLVQRGHAIHVYQPEYLDLCAGPVPIASCLTYRANSLEALEDLPASATQKLAVVAGTYLSRSELHMRAKRLYRAGRQQFARINVPLPAWNWERSTSAPVGTVPVFNRVASDLSHARAGDVVFAHLLMPHYPYVYDAACAPRPPSEWLTRSDASDIGVPGGLTNRPESRADRYARYLDQLACTRQKIGMILDAIPRSLRPSAIVIVQGDHGSRISLVDPTTATAAALVRSDYADHFSTLFAVRAPGVDAGADARVASIQCLLRALANSGFRSTADADACAVPRVVHLSDGRQPQPRPLPDFWTAPSPDRVAAAQ